MKGKRAGSLGSRNSLTESMNQKYRVWLKPSMYRGFFPDSSDGKESAGSSGDPSSIPGSGRSAGEGIRYPLQCSWASLVAQLVNNPPAVQETWVRSLGWEDPLELLEHLLQNQNLSTVYYIMPFTNSSDISRGLSPTTFLCKKST